MKISVEDFKEEDFFKTFEIDMVQHIDEAPYKTAGIRVYNWYPKIYDKTLLEIEEVILKLCNSKWYFIPMFNYYTDYTTGYTYIIEYIHNRTPIYYTEDDTRKLALMKMCVLIQEDRNIKPQIQEIFNLG